jgi:SUR7/PalI family
MGFIRPATPGFIVTLVATCLLAVVSFCVPYFKSVYFLKATTTVEGISGSITFGTLGYCLEVNNVTSCSKPSIGYELGMCRVALDCRRPFWTNLDINGLVGNKIKQFQIPQVAVKWITYALFSHVVALALAAGSSVFGLLAHVREMSMTCCSTCISGFAAAVALLAFIFDLVLFFVAKSRINAVGSAEIGNAIWLTLAAWVLLFLSGCFYTLGRCCVSRRPKGGSSRREGSARDDPFEAPKSNNNFTDRLRLDAVKAEADRKARERQAKEVGLPAFAETQPLTARVEGDHVYLDDDSKDTHTLSAPVTPNESANSRHRAAAGYVQAVPGSRAVDDYYNTAGTTSPPMPNTYPPQRQASGHAYPPTSGYEGATAYAPQRQASGYTASSYGQTGYAAGYHSTSPPPMPTHSALAVPGQQPYSDPYDPYGGQQYGHAGGGSSCTSQNSWTTSSTYHHP